MWMIPSDTHTFKHLKVIITKHDRYFSIIWLSVVFHYCLKARNSSRKWFWSNVLGNSTSQSEITFEFIKISEFHQIYHLFFSTNWQTMNKEFQRYKWIRYKFFLGRKSKRIETEQIHYNLLFPLGRCSYKKIHSKNDFGNFPQFLCWTVLMNNEKQC